MSRRRSILDFRLPFITNDWTTTWFALPPHAKGSLKTAGKPVFRLPYGLH
ncbi:hypothetical protein [Kingella oralis]|nr:hypothetical protein [Kingella oralis]